MTTTAVAGSSKPQMETNPRGIPRAPFVADVEDYVGGKDAEIESVMKTFQETSAKYRYMELSLQQRRKALTAKVPDIEQTLSVVKYLEQRRKQAAGGPVDAEGDDDLDEGSDNLDDLDEENKEEGPLRTLFELNDTLYAEAEIQETGQVGLWLGANTMLTYPLQEAIDLLEGKLSAAKKTLEETIEDLEWLREQVTVMEVNFARVHNWDVKRRRGQPKSAQNVVASGKQEKDQESDDDLD